MLLLFVMFLLLSHVCELGREKGFFSGIPSSYYLCFHNAVYFQIYSFVIKLENKDGSCLT